MLLGNYTSSLSQGKRLAVPKKFRTQLGENCILAKWYDKCLVLLSTEQWSELLQKLTVNESVPTAAVRDTVRFIMGSAYELTPDSQGRVVVPDALLQFAGISSDVVFLGLGSRVEIWDKKQWSEKESYIAEHAGGLLEELANGNAK